MMMLDTEACVGLKKWAGPSLFRPRGREREKERWARSFSSLILLTSCYITTVLNMRPANCPLKEHKMRPLFEAAHGFLGKDGEGEEEQQQIVEGVRREPPARLALCGIQAVEGRGVASSLSRRCMSCGAACGLLLPSPACCLLGKGSFMGGEGGLWPGGRSDFAAVDTSARACISCAHLILTPKFLVKMIKFALHF
jgi:hypothetical protein